MKLKDKMDLIQKEIDFARQQYNYFESINANENANTSFQVLQAYEHCLNIIKGRDQ